MRKHFDDKARARLPADPAPLVPPVLAFVLPFPALHRGASRVSICSMCASMLDRPQLHSRVPTHKALASPRQQYGRPGAVTPTSCPVTALRKA